MSWDNVPHTVAEYFARTQLPLPTDEFPQPHVGPFEVENGKKVAVGFDCKEDQYGRVDAGYSLGDWTLGRDVSFDAQTVDVRDADPAYKEQLIKGGKESDINSRKRYGEMMPNNANEGGWYFVGRVVLRADHEYAQRTVLVCWIQFMEYHENGAEAWIMESHTSVTTVGHHGEEWD